jgi:hypothetical protein
MIGREEDERKKGEKQGEINLNTMISFTSYKAINTDLLS